MNAGFLSDDIDAYISHSQTAKGGNRRYAREPSFAVFRAKRRHGLSVSLLFKVSAVALLNVLRRNRGVLGSREKLPDLLRDDRVYKRRRRRSLPYRVKG
jgi:hypothetical protein